MPTRTNVVAPLSSFFGREDAIVSLRAAMQAGARIVSVVGPPGMGKTRLLYRFAELEGATFLDAGGVWFCDLTAANDAGDLCAAVASAIGARIPEGLAASDRVAHVAGLLAELGPTLLLCDNFEQLDEASTLALETWCRAAPELRVLVSSRRRLASPLEIVFDLGPLELPTDDSGDSAAAVRLFVDRARACGGNLHDDESIRALVRELDGVPLAIELAAARTRVFTPRDLAARLARSHDVLDESANPRIRSLRSALERSWDVLGPAERSALVQCSYFAGDFSLEAAEAVVVLEDGSPAAVVEALSALRDRSLLAVHERDGEMRFRMIASLREFARTKASGQLDDERLRDRHRRHFARVAERITTALWRTGHVLQHRALERDRENILLAYRALPAEKTEDDHRDRWRLARALEPLLSFAGRFDELFASLDAAEESARVLDDARALAWVHLARGIALGLRGQTARSTSELEVAHEVALSAAANDVAAEAMLMLAVRLRARGLMEDAVALTTRGQALLEQGAWPRIEGGCTVVRGVLFVELAREEEARAANLRARSIFIAAEDRRSEALAIANLAQLDQAKGDFDRAAQGFDEALTAFREVGDRPYEARYLAYRAGVDHERGELASARALYRRALDLMFGLGLGHIEALVRACLGALEAEDGDERLAESELSRAMGLVLGADAPVARAAVEVHCAHRFRLRGDLVAARARITNASLAPASEDVRFAIRLLERALAKGAAATRPPAPAAGADLTIAAGCMAFRVGDGEVVDLTKRGALRRILAWLVEEQRSAPGTASGWPVLLEKGWPNERVLAEAGATRVRVAVATLRKLGLAGVLVTRDDGYLLSERARIAAITEFNEP